MQRCAEGGEHSAGLRLPWCDLCAQGVPGERQMIDGDGQIFLADQQMISTDRQMAAAD